MPTLIFLTVDTELAWRYHRAGFSPGRIYDHSLEPAEVGLSYQLETLARHGLKACFFVDPMPALTFGIAPIRRMVETVQAAGQEVQLHIHPMWVRAVAGDRGRRCSIGDMHAYSRDDQRSLIAVGRSLLMEAGAHEPVAFRAGSFAANDETLAALADLGFRYDSSHNGAECAHSRIGLPRNQISPVHRHLTEVPVTVIEDKPGHYRPLQLCAVSAGEMKAALGHAVRNRHVAVTIVNHSFELANRAGTKKNRVHVLRFNSLCRLLSECRSDLKTAFFSDGPRLPLTASDYPLGSSLMRTTKRRIEQAWSNVVEER
jgi:peptidoglycan/xylan/chitin deacetylase (PgdA/CDA1 family)